MPYCVVEYRPKPWTVPPESPAPIFLLALTDQEGLCLFLNPSWTEFVREEDMSYIQALIPSLKRKSEHELGTLFEELSELSLGPLVTADVGPDLSGQPSFHELTSKFCKL
jgi:hypothetical protein